jgi:hypothetical protein
MDLDSMVPARALSFISLFLYFYCSVILGFGALFLKACFRHGIYMVTITTYDSFTHKRMTITGADDEDKA